jgi:hypothetical protein
MRVKQRQVSSWMAFLASLAATAGLQSGCSDATGAGGGGDDCGDLEFTEEEAGHACKHVEDGPFGDLASGDELGNLHMLYTLTLDGEGETYSGTLTFIARESAVHAFVLMESGVPLKVRSGETALCLAEDEPDGCDAFKNAHLVELERNAEVVLEIGPTSKSSIRLIAERQ